MTLRGWGVFWWCFKRQLNKKHGTGRVSFREMVHVALCARYISNGGGKGGHPFAFPYSLLFGRLPLLLKDDRNG